MKKNYYPYLVYVLLALLICFVSCTQDSPKDPTTNDETTTTTSVEATTTTTGTTTTTTIPGTLSEASLVNGPEDWRDQVIYFMITDRFKDGDTGNNETRFRDNNPATPLHNPADHKKYHGGDLKGIMDNVGYLTDLGVNSIWITPVVYNMREDDGYTGYHGYWAWDMTMMDPHLIPNDLSTDKNRGINFYKHFVDTMHANNIYVIQDIVLNHMGNLFLYKIGGKENWNPTYKATGYGEAALLWIEESSHAGSAWIDIGLRRKPPAPFDSPSFYNLCGTLSDSYPLLGDLSGLDDLKTTSPDVRTVLKNIYIDWIKYAGIDGFRIDTVKHIETDFFEDFNLAVRNYVKGNNPNKKFIQFGEYFGTTHSVMKDYTTGNKMDSLLNFELYYAMNNVFRTYSTNGTLYATNKLTKELNNRSVLRDTPISDGGAGLSAADAVVNFIDNHDVARYLNAPGHNTTTLKSALAYILTTKGIPCIYYGTEKDLKASSASAEPGRIDMPNFDTTGDTYNFLKDMIKVRKDNVALRRGEIKVMKDSANAGIFAFSRYTGAASENIYVFFNTAKEDLADDAIYDSSEVDLLTKDETLTKIYPPGFKEISVMQDATGDYVKINLDAYSFKIFKKK